MADEMVIMIINITSSCCMEDGSLGYPGASTVTNQPLDSTCIMLPWLAIPATQL